MSDLTMILIRLAPGSFEKVNRYTSTMDDTWDFSSPATCQWMLDNLVVWSSAAVKPNGQQVFDALPTQAQWEADQVTVGKDIIKSELASFKGDDNFMKVLKAVVLCIDDGSIVPGANLQAQGAAGLAQLRDAVKAKL